MDWIGNKYSSISNMSLSNILLKCHKSQSHNHKIIVGRWYSDGTEYRQFNDVEGYIVINVNCMKKNVKEFFSTLVLHVLILEVCRNFVFPM